MFKVKEKIDIVFTWVDGSDPNWQEKAKKYMPERNFDNERFRDWGTFKYVFRSIEKYALWVHHIYIITDNQCPNWLDLSNSKVSIVDHKEIIDEKYLPTFNSNVIQVNAHKIPGLSEKFIIFNDDMFLNAPVKETDFFRNGLPCDFLIENALTASIPWFKSLFGAMLFINQKFNKREFIKKNFNKYFSVKYGIQGLRSFLSLPYSQFTGFMSTHWVQPFLKSTFENVWTDFGKELEKSSYNHVRNANTDIPDYLMRYYQLASGNFTPVKISKRSKFLPIGDEFDVIKNVVTKEQYLGFCLNDDLVEDDQYEKIKKRTIDLLENKFPEKSNFEK